MQNMQKINPQIAATFMGASFLHFPFKNNEEHPECIRIKKYIQQTISALYHETGVRQFLCGVTPGIEMWAAEIVLDLMKDYPDLELYCVVSFSGQSDKWSLKKQARYKKILEQCTEIIYLHTKEDSSKRYWTQKMFLLDHTNVLIAVFEIHTSPKGTLMRVLNKARENGTRIIFVS